jgi:hypothetical protein
MVHRTGSLLAAAFSTLVMLSACGGPRPPYDWGDYDVLTQDAPAPERKLGEVTLEQRDYEKFLVWGERWFRGITFGNERVVTDVVGIMNGVVQVPVPCDPPGAAPCRRDERVLTHLFAAIDKLDGAAGNLFAGNGGALGPGFTSDLVLEFPPGTTLRGIPVPERLHTGLDVEAGASYPLGLVPVPAPAADQHLPYLIDPPNAGFGPAPAGKVRLGITCAICHYSLDVDFDGMADLRSAIYTPGNPQLNSQQKARPDSPYLPQHAWALGNQNLHFGWLFGLAANPLLGFTVLSGTPGKTTPDDARAFVQSVIARYEQQPEQVMHDVILGMLAQPRGAADDTPDARYNPVQLPALYTHRTWPYNSDGALLNASDRNNGVWTGALDFTGLIGLAKDRAQQQQKFLFWEPRSVYELLTSERFADIMVRYSPAVLHDPQQLAPLKADILGTSDGVPGMLALDSIVVMEGPGGIVPKSILNHPANVQGQRIRKYSDYPGDADERGPVMALLGTRVRTPPAVLQEIGYDALKARYPQLNKEEIVTDAVSLMLDWAPPPPNTSRLLASAWGDVRKGYQVFQEEGCAGCHAGPFFTNNLMNRLERIKTQPDRSIGTRALQRFVAPDYDPATGRATERGDFAKGFFGNKAAGYKTFTLRNVWGTAPYLHDGGVAIALRPDATPAEDDLRELLRRTPHDKIYGMGGILELQEREPQRNLRANAALSLQALLLKSERVVVLRENHMPRVPVIGRCAQPGQSAPCAPALLPVAKLGMSGKGHEHWVDDFPGGERITALIAFLLALDDRPGTLR